LIDPRSSLHIAVIERTSATKEIRWKRRAS
jgi:hypothetical protein